MNSIRILNGRPLPFCIRLCVASLVLLSIVHLFCVNETLQVKLLLDGENRDLRQEATQSLATDGKYQKVTFVTAAPFKVKILFWVAPNNPPAKIRLERLKDITKHLNGETQGKRVCPRETEEKKYTCEFSVGENVTDVDAVVFFMFTTGYKRSDLPTERRPEQLWVMYALEPPPFSNWPNSLENLFNWTASYRMDSDVWTPYGKKIPLPSSENAENSPIYFGNVTLKEWISGKSKLAAAVISNCRTSSHRELLISEMNKTSPGQVEVFGACGQGNVCGRYVPNCTDFWMELAKQYKFYLSFENALCEDYITEKFWRTLTYGMVPVVFGGGNYSLQAPPNSFINVLDFESVESLMQYLKTLDENEDEYAKYFYWRRNFYIQEERWITHDWCDLCKALYHQKSINSSKAVNKFHGDLKWWWHHRPNSNESACEKE